MAMARKTVTASNNDNNHNKGDNSNNNNDHNKNGVKDNNNDDDADNGHNDSYDNETKTSTATMDNLAIIFL